MRSIFMLASSFLRLSYLRLLMLAALTAHNPTAHAIDQEEELRDVEQWRTGRIARLTSDTGYLTLVGLYWLSEGSNNFGRDTKNQLVLDRPDFPRRLGRFQLKNGAVSFAADAGNKVMHDGKPISTISMAPDTSGSPTVLSHGTVQFFVIERAGKLGVRVRDTNHPARRNFHSIDYFPVDSGWNIDARFEAYQPPRQIEIVNILGMTEKMSAPGAAVFTKDGKEYRLDLILEEPGAKELFVMFADATSGRETYGAGRFIYIPLPNAGRINIDFNRAYNPPCAFNDFATCPLPPWQNRLALRVTAGEKKYQQSAH